MVDNQTMLTQFSTCPRGMQAMANSITDQHKGEVRWMRPPPRSKNCSGLHLLTLTRQVLDLKPGCSLSCVSCCWSCLRRKHWPQSPVWMLAAHVQSDQNHTSVACPGSSFLSTWHIWARLDKWPQTMAIYLCNNQSTTAGLLVSDTRLTCPPSVAWSVTRPPCLGWSVWRI